MKASTSMYLLYNKYNTQLHYLQHYIHQYDDTCKGEAFFTTIIYLPLCIFVKILLMMTIMAETHNIIMQKLDVFTLTQLLCLTVIVY